MIFRVACAGDTRRGERVGEIGRETGQILECFTSACSHKYPERQWCDFAFKHATPVCGRDREEVGAETAERNDN